MRPGMLPLLVLPLLASTACEYNRTALVMTQPSHLRLPDPDRSFRLAPEDRAKVIEFFDVDALERLLGMIRPEERPQLLIMFQYRETPKSEPRGLITDLHDPELQAVLEEVWAPYWDEYSDEQLEKERAPLPGRELAKQRREARRRGDGGRRPE